jgi:TolB-like protein/lipoprotein NlpI
MSLFHELKRRSVFRVAMAYLAASWLLIEVTSTVFPAFGVPDWGVRFLVIACALRFLPALILSWIYELTPGGVVRDEPVARSSVRRLDLITILLVVVALSIFLADNFWFDFKSQEQEAASAELADNVGLSQPRYPSNSIAVLPFVNMSDDAANEYFSDGITEELLNLLAQVQQLRVISRSSAFFYKGKDVNIPSIAQQLNVANILEGSVRKSGDRVRITAQLIDTHSDTHIWSATFDRTLDDIFAIQDEIARTVVQRLKVTLLGDTPTSEQMSTEAYTLYLQARQLGRKYSADGFEQSNELYRKALAIDADIAGAWSGLSTNYTNQAINGLLSFEKGFSEGRLAAQKALEIDPEYAPAHANLGWIAYAYDNDVSQATHHYQQALNLAPTNTYIIRSTAMLLSSLNRLGDAITLGEYVTRLDPLVASGHHNLGISYFRAHRWDEAIASQRTVLLLSPDYIGANYYIGLALLFSGKTQAALDAFALEQDEEYRVKGAALALHALGRQEESQVQLAELIERWGGEWPTEVAHVHAYIGDADAAFRWLDKAIEENEEGLAEQFLQPYFDTLHEDPRWRAFLERVGSLPEQLNDIEFEVTLPD